MTILYLKLESFYAAVEQRLVPTLAGRPLVVGAEVVESCSPEALAAGVSLGMTVLKARRQCPAATFLPLRQERYRAYAAEVRELCQGYMQLLESYDDYLFGDISGMAHLQGDPMSLAAALASEIRARHGLSVRLGLAPNRLLARLAAEMDSTARLAQLEAEQVAPFLDRLPVRRLPGLEGKALAKLKDMNIRMVGELRALPRPVLRLLLGCAGDLVYEWARGRDPQRLDAQARPTSICRETVLDEAESDVRRLRAELHNLLADSMRELRQAGLMAAGLALHLVYHDEKTYRTRKRLPTALEVDAEFVEALDVMLARLHVRRVSVRRLGITLEHLSAGRQCGELFDVARQERRRSLYRCLDVIRRRFGSRAIRTASGLEELAKAEATQP